MNKRLFSTGQLTAQQTGSLSQELTTYVDSVAANLIRSDPDCDEKAFESRAQQEVSGSSWVVGTSRRNFAFHATLSLLDSSHTMGAVRPTAEQATIAIARYVARRCMQLSESQRGYGYRLRFKMTQKMLTLDDINPTQDDESVFYATQATKPEIRAFVLSFYKSYITLGVTPPTIEVIVYNKEDEEIETFTVEN
jgi:hypothetical protein